MIVKYPYFKPLKGSFKTLENVVSLQDGRSLFRRRCRDSKWNINEGDCNLLSLIWKIQVLGKYPVCLGVLISFISQFCFSESIKLEKGFCFRGFCLPMQRRWIEPGQRIASGSLEISFIILWWIWDSFLTNCPLFQSSQWFS